MCMYNLKQSVKVIANISICCSREIRNRKVYQLNEVTA